MGAIVLLLALSACSPANLRGLATQTSQLIVPVLSTPSTFNYPLNESFYSVFGFIYEGLLTENGITGELEPAIAESWEISDDNLNITFKLRDGLKWSDGEPLTVDDVVFTYQDIYLNEKIPTGIRDILRIGPQRKLPKVTKVDELRVRFTVPEPFAPFLRYAGGIPVLPEHLLRETVETLDDQGNPRFLSIWGTDTDPREVVGNGPYTMESFTTGQRVLFVRNPHYWRKDAQGIPQPYIDRIIYQIIESTDNQILRFRSGELDSLIEVPPEAFPLLKRQEDQGRFTIYNLGVSTSTTFIAFNLNRAKTAEGKPLVDPIKSRWFNTKAFRQAIAYAIDREAMKTTVFRGLGELQNSFIFPKSPYYLSPEEGLKVYDYNPDKAKELLQGAGFRYDDQNRLLDDQGNLVEFVLLTNAERKTRQDMAAQIRQNLADIGIKVDVQILSFNTYIQRLGLTRDWECYLGGFGGGGIEPHGSSNIWSVEGTLHTFNQGPLPGEEKPIVGWEASDWEKEISDLFIKASQALDDAKRKQFYAQAQQIAQEQLPFIHLVERLNMTAIRDRVENFKPSATASNFWNLPELRLAN